MSETDNRYKHSLLCAKGRLLICLIFEYRLESARD